MKRIIQFSKGFVPAAVLSAALLIFGIVGYFALGFNYGVDFQAGLLQEVQIAPTAFNITYSGRGDASVQLSRSALSIVITGSATTEGGTHEFRIADYPTLGELASGMRADIDGLNVENKAPASTPTTQLLQSAYGTPLLDAETPYSIHYLSGTEPEIAISEIRDSFPESLGTVSVQEVGAKRDRHFMIRIDTNNVAADVIPETVAAKALAERFGTDEIVITRSDKVDSRFSEGLAGQAGILLVLTLIVILIYSSIRFKPQYAIGAVLAILHDGIIMVMFVVWSRMEFNTTTIAAILTILGYSINDTIVIFDRIRETRHLFPDYNHVQIIDRALTETLSRTIITTFTTMLAVLSLFIFTTGSMKDFALALLVGMISGVYSTIFIACGFTEFYEKKFKKHDKNADKKQLKAAATLA